MPGVARHAGPCVGLLPWVGTGSNALLPLDSSFGKRLRRETDVSVKLAQRNASMGASPVARGDQTATRSPQGGKQRLSSMRSSAARTAALFSFGGTVERNLTETPSAPAYTLESADASMASAGAASRGATLRDVS